MSSFLAEVIMISTVPTGSPWLSNATTSGCYATHDQPVPSQRDQRWRACPLPPSLLAKAFFARALSSNLGRAVHGDSNCPPVDSLQMLWNFSSQSSLADFHPIQHTELMIINDHDLRPATLCMSVQRLSQSTWS